jgi:hypothetical protein
MNPAATTTTDPLPVESFPTPGISARPPGGLRSGSVIAYPTEAVYGLGCDPLDANAVERLLTLKQRPLSAGLILIAADFAQVEPYLEPLSAALRRKIFATWPGPVTWLLPARPEVPVWLRGQTRQPRRAGDRPCRQRRPVPGVRRRPGVHQRQPARPDPGPHPPAITPLFQRPHRLYPSWPARRPAAAQRNPRRAQRAPGPQRVIRHNFWHSSCITVIGVPLTPAYRRMRAPRNNE